MARPARKKQLPEGDLVEKLAREARALRSQYDARVKEVHFTTINEEARALWSEYDALGPISDFPDALQQRAREFEQRLSQFQQRLEALQLRAFRFEQQLSQLEGRMWERIPDLVPRAKERINSKRRRKEIVEKSNRTISTGVKDRLARIPILWEEEKKLHPNDLLDIRIEHVRAKLIAEGFRRGTSRDNFERDLKKLKEDGALLD